MSYFDEQSVSVEKHQTPFGLIALNLVEHASGRVALLLDEPEPRAALYAAKLAGATRVVEVLTTTAVDRLLRPGDRLVPDDLVDLTSGQLQTFFVNKGYGFMGQRPVFCPELRGALLDGLRALPEGRSFARGVLAVVNAPEPLYPRVAPGQLEEARAWGAHVLGWHGAPAAYLAKELELCYAVVCSNMWLDPAGRPVYRPRGQELLEAALSLLPASRACACKDAMQPTRQRGLIGDDWKTWI
jgi:5'-methylthioadenosine phosphorylase